MKRVTTKIVWSMNTGEVLAHEWHNYSGTWELCKGDSTSQAAEQQSMQFQSQLMSLFSQQYGKQAEQLQFLNKVLKPMVQNPQGYQPAELAALRASATDNIAQQGAGVQQAIANRYASTSGTDLPSGVNAQLSAGASVAQAQQETAAQNDITAQNANLRLSNFWSSIAGLSGNASMLAPNQYAHNANSAGDTTANLGYVYNQSKQSGVLGALTGLAGATGTALSGGSAGKIFG